jgi:MOSC domain-containing protein YiiM
MELVSVNVGPARDHLINDKLVSTAIVKTPVHGPVMMHPLGLDGDAIGNTKHHGGRDQAVYAYAADHYDAWARELGRDDLTYGMMGENLTVRGWLESDVCIGDTFRVGGAVVQVTSPRSPCYKLDWRIGDKGFSKKFSDTGRYGIYLRVVEPGTVRAGDDVTLVKKSPDGLPLLELAALRFNRPKDVDGMRRALQAEGLNERFRAAFEERIAAAG